MSNTTFRAVFEAEDKSFSSVMRRMRDESNAMAEGMLSDANKISQASGQKVNKVLEEQIALYEKRSRLMRSQEAMELVYRRDQAMSSAKNDDQRRAIQHDFVAQRRGLTEQYKQDDMQLAILKDILSAINDTANRQIVENKKAVDTNVRLVNSGTTGGMTTQQEYVARVQAGMIERETTTTNTIMATAIGTFLGNTAKEWKDNAVRTAIGMVNSVPNAADSEPVLAQLWKAVPYVGEALAAAEDRHLETSENRDRAAYRLNAFGAGLYVPDSFAHEQHIAAMRLDKARKQRDWDARGQADFESLFGEDSGNWRTPNEDATIFDKQFWTENLMQRIPGVALITDIPEREDYRKLAKARWDQENDAMDAAIKAEQDAFALNAHAFANQWSYHAAGWDQTEFLGKAEQIAPMIGNISNINADTRTWIDAYQGASINEGALGSVAGLNRYGSWRSDVDPVTGDLLEARPSSFGENLVDINSVFAYSGMDPSRRGEFFGDVGSLGQARIDAGFRSVDVGQMAGIKYLFEHQYGTAFASNSNILGIQQALSNPNDSWQQALNYQIYAKQKMANGESVSYVDFMKWQEDPFTSGLMGGTSDYLMSLFGQGELGQIAFKNRFGSKTWEQASIMASNPTGDEFDWGMGYMDVPSVGLPSAAANASGRQRNQAELTDAFTVSAYEGLKTAFSQIGESIANKIMSSPFPFSADIAATVRMWLTD